MLCDGVEVEETDEGLSYEYRIPFEHRLVDSVLLLLFFCMRDEALCGCFFMSLISFMCALFLLMKTVQIQIGD